jgi:hypothetical protein
MSPQARKIGSSTSSKNTAVPALRAIWTGERGRCMSTPGQTDDWNATGMWTKRQGKRLSAERSLRWKSIVLGWLVASVSGLAISPLLRTLYGLAVPPPTVRGDFTADLVIVSLASGFLAYVIGGYVAARNAGRKGGMHGAMAAIFGLMVGIILALVLTVFGATFVEGVAVPPAGFGLTGRALLIGALPLFFANLLAGYVGGKLGEPPESLTWRNK